MTYEYETLEAAIDAIESMTETVEEDLGVDCVGADVVFDLARNIAFDCSPNVRTEVGLYYGLDVRGETDEILDFARRSLSIEEAEADRLLARIEASPTDRPELRERRDAARRRAEAVRARIVDIRKTVAPEIRR